MQQSTIVGTATGPVRSISTAAKRYAQERGISAATLAAMPVASGTVFFPSASSKQDGLFFDFGAGSWKARSLIGKHFTAAKGSKFTFWNLPAVLAGPKIDVFVTEGEMDALALVEAGVPADAVLSVPGGAREKPAGEGGELRGYDYALEALQAGLSGAARVIWCGDNDGPGLALRSDMARLFGAARFHWVDWPEGCKDANDALLKIGAAALGDLVMSESKPWPVDGLYRLSELPEPPPLLTWEPGFPEWESKVRLAPGMVSLVTGHPGHGKTALCAQIWFNVVKKYDVPIAVASFETRAKPHLRRQLRSLVHGRLERDLSDDERRSADAWINERYFFLQHPDGRPTLNWLLDLAEVAVVRHGARIVQLDPWNRLEAGRDRSETETEYILRCLRAVYQFAVDFGVHVQILAHPAKMDAARRGDAPMLEDVAGSKHWENVVDQGFSVHRPNLVADATGRPTEAVLFHRKARFEELGYPCKLNMNYDLTKGRYVSTDYAIGY